VPQAAGRLVAVSPHCDDAVLACGQVLAAHPRALVVTCFAGRTSPPPPLTGWDGDCGFREGDDVVGLRRAEDRAALAEVGAAPIWLDFPDAQYAPSPTPEAVAAALAAVIVAARPGVVLLPLGLFHSDHHLAHDAARRLVADLDDVTWLAYEDALYRRLPGLVQDRLVELAGARLAPRRAWPDAEPGLDRKRRAVACYASQLRGLATAGRLGHADAFAAEGYWRIGR
jgi:LmbE family N-acetylglucosaminyl deacetylase